MAKREFNTDEFPSGMLSTYGRRPGTEYPWKGHMFADNTVYQLTYTTTPEAIKKVLPPPLEPIPDMPPVITVFIGHCKHGRFFDGKYANYVEVGFFVPCQYKDYKGVHPMWIMMDTMSGDKTEGAELAVVTFRETSGWMKFIGNNKLGGTGDQIHFTCDVKGVRLITLDIETPEEITAADMNKSYGGYRLFVKEIPNCNFTGYDVRKIIGRTGKSSNTMTNLKKGTGKISFGNLETHPMHILECVEPGPAYQLTFQTGYEDTMNGYFEIEDLLKKESNYLQPSELSPVK